MKKPVMILLSVLAALSVAACGTMTFSRRSRFADPPAAGDVTVSVKENSLHDTGLVLLIRNQTSRELTYDMTYALEQKKDGAWYAWDRELSFNAIAAVLKPDAVNEFPVSWDAGLPKGLYRIVKPVAAAGGVQYPAAEFSVG